MKKSILSLLIPLSLISVIAIAKTGQPDKDMKKVLSELMAKNGKPIETLSAVEARTQPTPADAVKEVMRKEHNTKQPELAEVKEIQVDGASGKIPARLYIPKAKGPLPVVVYYHGGGFVIATNDVYDATPRSLAEQTKAIFVSVEYRKGPEFKFPAAHDDAFAAYKWVVSNAASFGGDAKKIAVAGESAGGNLALNVAIKARDEGVQTPTHQLLIYPVASNDMNSESYKENAAAKPLNKPMMEWFIKNYTRTPEDVNDSRLNLVAANLKGLPPATIIAAEIDPLRTEGKNLADKLKSAGVEVEYKNYKGVSHEFFGMASVVKEARDAQKFAAKELKHSFN
ncbi:MAG: alpha/beta hydrolase [Bdellovibrionaceae bacterium]|nr:alpha/beta hydrolase [Bdellovibrio sp.]